MQTKKFLEYLKKTQVDCEKHLQLKNAFDAYPKTIESKNADCYENLAIIYKFWGDEEKSKWMFQYFTSFRVPSLRLEGLTDEEKTNIHNLIDEGIYQFRKGIYFNLAQTNPQKATQLFEWAAENCNLPDEYIADEIMAKNFDDIAVGHLWRGYALLNLGKYEEAHELLIQVIPYLNKYKKTGEMWRKIEYVLPKALVPLCEYKIDPTPVNLQGAQNGIEDYIKGLREPKFKLEGYLYYFHLKEMFPEVYNTEIAETPVKKPPKKKKTIKKLDLPPGESDTEGSVIVFDIKGGYLDVFGTNNELEEYVEKVEELGEYPMLAGLMELYAMEGQEEPEPIIEECERLLASPDADDFLKQKTKILLDAAQDAKSEGGTIMLYFDDEV